MPTAIIVGAGIGGLAAAIALRREGWAVMVLEHAKELKEIGAGVQIPPNAGRILLKWGLGEKIHRVSCVAKTGRVWKCDNLTVVAQWPFKTEEMFGMPYYFIHRGEYHTILRDEAVASSLSSPVANPGPPVNILLDSAVISVDCDSTTVLTSDGRSFSGDVVVGADGVRSVVKIAVTEESDHAKSTGDIAYRFLIPTEKIKQHPELSFALEPAMDMHVGRGCHVVTYLISEGAYLNVAACGPDDNLTDESWNQRGSQEELLNIYKGWSPQMIKLMSLSDSYLKWQLKRRDELSTWVRGNTTLLGDACHAMVPYLAQGAAQAVEDAAALGLALGSGLPIPEALKAYEVVRKPRTTAIVQATDAARARLRIPEGPPKESDKNEAAPHVVWMYDAEMEMSKHLSGLLNKAA
ncbi:hypothetical protein HDU93_009958 [Gonapodya sp. JEL0774]|nr:hypothetical protein HDU93_009958 [Gonapodya sp. JEL0774]